MRVSHLMAVAAVSAGLVAPACFLPFPQACTLVGFENGLRVEIRVPPAAATYTVEVEAEGDLLVLDFDNPDGAFVPECLAPCGMSGAKVSLHPSFSSSDDALAILIAHLDGDSGPKRAIVRVFTGDQQLAEATLEPKYARSEPNGEGCGEHVSANALIELESPTAR